MSSIAEMEQALIEATLKKYQDIIDNLDRISTTLDNSLELIEARGETPTESDYQRPLEVANEQIDKLYDKREQLLKKQAIYDVGSELYDDYANQIADIDDEIYGLLGDIEKLKDSIEESPDLLEARDLIVKKNGKKYVIIGGNMRFHALGELGYKKVPCIVLPDDIPVEKLKEIAIKDNGNFGKWDWRTGRILTA